MGNMFKCVLASGTGTGIPLIVTCPSSFAGFTITCTDGTTTLTDTCPSSSPYEVTFNLPNIGTWTVSGGTQTRTVTVTEETVILATVPDGSTVTPTDDVQTLLNCANIWDKSYSTVSALLADTTSLLAVISDNNAVDYLVRSTTFATDICADSTAMTYIGADNYCANTLLADSTWLSAICNSTYFENVLNVKVPTMTSNTTPSGVASMTDNSSTAWKSFDGNISTNSTMSGDKTSFYQRYDFGTNKHIYRAEIYTKWTDRSGRATTLNLQYSDNGTNFTNAVANINATNDSYNKQTGDFGTHRYWQFTSAVTNFSKGEGWPYVQFYGREDV